MTWRDIDELLEPTDTVVRDDQLFGSDDDSNTEPAIREGDNMPKRRKTGPVETR